ncbi:DUF1934 family protein [Weissella confusa]|uniref:DUF1934 family protein n=1 Tax=Weissella confusa TaxID=1583 RepID=A0A923NE81_WEICO|nr:DUF1934 family protein [Weissella confusa]
MYNISNPCEQRVKKVFGSMSIDVRTNDLKTVLDEDFGHVNVAYSLLAGETLLGDYSLELHFEK